MIFPARIENPNYPLLRHPTLTHPNNFQMPYESTFDRWWISPYFEPSTTFGRNRDVSGFCYFLPPGIKRVTLSGTHTAITHGGDSFYAAVRYDQLPTATLNWCNANQSQLPQLSGIWGNGLSQYAQRESLMLSERGFVGKRTVLIGEYAPVHATLSVDPSLLTELWRYTGVWVYVNYLNRSGWNSIMANTFRSRFEVDYDTYVAWYNDTLDIPPDLDPPDEEDGLPPLQEGTWRLLNDWQLSGLHPVLPQLYAGRYTYGIHYDETTKCVYSGYGLTLWTSGPWTHGEPNLHWMPTEPGFWGCFIARHSVVPLPPVTDIDDIITPDKLGVPMIWTMPNEGD